MSTPSVDIAPLTPERWPDVEKLFGKNGACAGCWCMFWKQAAGEFAAGRGAPNKRAFRKIVLSGQVPGLLATVDGVPAGWCAVEPRERYGRLARARILKGLDMPPAWSVPCFFVARPFRRQGLSVKLLKAAVAHARRGGASLVEGYPVAPKAAGTADAFAYHGLASAFEAAGFEEVARPSATRRVMRRNLVP